MARSWPIAGLALALTGAVLGGCGGDGDALPQQVPRELEASPIARIAVAGPATTLDPLFVANRTERLISRQIYEPLSARIGRPFGGSGTRRGPARPLGAENGGRIWRFEIRPEAVFHDGSRLNADAVIANYERWLQNGIAARLLPEVSAVDSPQPGEVRFQLDRPVLDFPRQLEDPRLGLLAPVDIPAAADRPARMTAAGTGPYALRERQATRLLLVRSPDWWGEGAGLGPGINQFDFVLTPAESARVELLAAGSVALADDLGSDAAAELSDRPLVATLSDGGTTIGESASVRGLDSADADQSLSGIWLTELR